MDDLNFILATPALHDAEDASITNDDSQPIQDAIDSFGDNGGTAYFPAGTYVCQGTVVLDNHSKIALIGPAARLGLGSGGAALSYAGSSGSLITLNTSSDIFFLHLAFQCSNPNYGGDLVKSGWSSAPITQVEVAENVLTVTANNNFGIGTVVTFRNLKTATFLNGQTVAILTASATQFTAEFTHADYSPTADEGSAVREADTAYLVWERCMFSGPPNVTSARSLLSLPKCIISTIRDRGLIGAQIGIWGVDGAYSNAICVQQCAFNNCDQWVIFNPGESWTISNCTFEPDSLGRASGIGTDRSGYSYGPAISGCWFGDAGTPGKPWNKVFVVGASITGNYVAPAGGASDPAFIVTAGSQGVFFGGNRIEGGIGIKYPAVALITQVELAANVLTITANNNFAIGTIVKFEGVATATFLNGQMVTILTVSATQFTANLTHADYGPTADTGYAADNDTGGEYVFGSAVIGNDFETGVPIANAGNVVPLTLLANTSLANYITYGLKLGSGEAGWSSDALMNLGYITTLPQNLLVSAVAWMDSATRDADDNPSFVHGSLGLIAPSGQPTAEVLLLAGLKGAHRRPATVARFGYSSTGFPYMKGALVAETLGAVVASQGTIVATGQIFHLSGATTVSTIAAPFDGFTGRITIIADGAFSWNTAGNIGRAGTAQVGLAVSFVYDGSRWWPTS